MLESLLRKLYILFILISISYNLNAKQDTIKNSLQVSGYLEIYYCYDMSKPTNHIRPPFTVAYNRHNEININIGYIKAAYETESIRTNLALMTGTYANTNLATEPGVLKMIYQANAGVKILKQKNLWVDAGVFDSHIGAESAIGKDCWNLTRSMAADNSPYYEAGAKISYTTDNSKWFVSGLILNGWQHIQRPDGNNTLTLGHQLIYTPNKKIKINSSSFIGNDKPDTVKQMRYFHNLYGSFAFSDRWGLLGGFDIGWEQKQTGSSQYNAWYTPYLLLQYKLSSKFYLAARAEYYSDRNNVIITTNTPNGFQTAGYSLNADVRINEHALWRIEARTFQSKDKIFTLQDKASTENYFITTLLAISF
jgi:hypothetical protein